MSSLALDDDEFLLDEASVAEFLADCEMTKDTTSLELDSAATSLGCTSSSSLPHKAANRKAWYQRRKEQIGILREEAKQLSAKLDALKLIATSYQDSTSSSPIKTKTEVFAWEAFAEYQSQLRQMSEVENVKLREELKNHQQQAKSLQRAVKRKFRATIKSPVVALSKRYQLDCTTVRPPLDNQAVFDQLKGGMDSMYADVDAFFSRVGMDEAPCPGRRNTSMLGNPHGIMVEFLDNYTLPFDLRQTENVIWKIQEPPAKDCMGMFFLEQFSDGDNIRMKSFSFPFTMDGINFRVVIRRVTKKFVEDDKIVFITRSLYEPVIGLGSIVFVETTRTVLKRGEMSPIGPMTKMQTHREAAVRGNVFTWDLAGCPSVEEGLKIWEGGADQFKFHVEDQLLRAARPHTLVYASVVQGTDPVISTEPRAWEWLPVSYTHMILTRQPYLKVRVTRVAVHSTAHFKIFHRIAKAMACDEELQIIKSSVQAFLADYGMTERATTIPTIRLETSLSSIELPILPSSLGKPVASQKKKFQQRQTEEVLHLQILANQLSMKLRKLKLAAAGGRPATKRTNLALKPSAKNPQVKVEGVLIWKSIAERQFKLRHSCEVENAKLRRALRSHFRRAQSYQHALKVRFPRPTESCRNGELNK